MWTFIQWNIWKIHIQWNIWNIFVFSHCERVISDIWFWGLISDIWFYRGSNIRYLIAPPPLNTESRISIYYFTEYRIRDPFVPPPRPIQPLEQHCMNRLTWHWMNSLWLTHNKHTMNHWGGACPSEGWFLQGCAPDYFVMSPRSFRCEPQILSLCPGFFPWCNCMSPKTPLKTMFSVFNILYLNRVCCILNYCTVCYY